jgi:predicted phosphohydrolase
MGNAGAQLFTVMILSTHGWTVKGRRAMLQEEDERVDRVEIGRLAEQLRRAVEEYLAVVSSNWTEAVMVVDNQDGRDVVVRIERAIK